MPFVWIFTDYLVHNFEIRVGGSEDIGKNNICHEQFDFMDSPQTMIRCSRALYGDWVSINSTKTGFATEYLAFNEFRVFGRKYVWNIHLKIKCISSLLIAKVNYSTIKAQCIKMAITLTDTLVYESLLEPDEGWVWFENVYVTVQQNITPASLQFYGCVPWNSEGAIRGSFVGTVFYFGNAW